MRRYWRLARVIPGAALAVVIFATVLRFVLPAQVQPTPVVYVSPETCAGCHADVWETYRRTGMARSFYRPSAATMREDGKDFYHPPSDSYFAIEQRGGKYFQRRYQLDSSGRQINVMEKQIDFVMGSGDHARTYLHQTSQGMLLELPLGWYAEKGGYWAMNPGYDRPDQDGFRRRIGYDCMFCHNGYPQIPSGHDQPFAQPVYTSLPQGIDCQRCHGPGSKHAEAAKAGAPRQQIRNAIVNPARLTPQRQMELCMACHLETTSFPLPNALQRYERGPFSYRPGEPLGAFLLSFDHAPGTGHDEKFEIVSSAYRLRKSACFLKSNDRLQCTSCHNPHDSLQGEAAAAHYTAVCRQCHAALEPLIKAGKHSNSADCVACHMPKRRTEDAVHVIATDHYIQRHKPAGDLLADFAERHETAANAYRGPVVLYYPKEPGNELYQAIAQVNQRSNLKDGIKQLTAALERGHPQRAEYYFELAEALRDNGETAKALPIYRDSIRRNPKFVLGLQRLASALRRSGQAAEAVGFLDRAAAVEPANALTWRELAITYQALGKKALAIAALNKAITLDPDMPEAHNNLGIIRFAAGEQAPAEAAFREAIRIQPDYADAHGNLANLLSQKGDFGDFNDARHHFEISLRLRPEDASTHYNFAMALGRARLFEEAQRELEASLRFDPKLTDAHQLLADLLMAKGQAQAALPHYREVLLMQPQSGLAHLNLGLALAAVGDSEGALPHLRQAATDPDPAVRDEAAQTLRRIGK